MKGKLYNINSKAAQKFINLYGLDVFKNLRNFFYRKVENV